MERKSLVCDWCPEVRRPAVPYALVNGRSAKPLAARDLCPVHLRELVRLMRLRGKADKDLRVLARPPKGERRKPKVKRVEAARGHAGRAAMERRMEQVVALLGKMKTPLSREDIAKGIKVRPLLVTGALVKLRGAKRIVESGRGRARRWELTG